MHLKKKDVFAEQAKVRMLSGVKIDPDQNSGQGSMEERTDRKLAKQAGVSHDTIHRVSKIVERAKEEDLEALRKGKTSIIHEQQDTGDWGDSVVKTLASDLQKTFPGMRGFSYRNLYTMRDLYTSYRGNEKLQTVSAQISWSHNVAILSKCKDPIEREFYMKMSKRNGWTYRVLLHHIEIGTFERTMVAQSNFKEKLPTNLHPEAILVAKDEYALDFLGLADEHSEQELEKAFDRFVHCRNNLNNLINHLYLLLDFAHLFLQT